jgi:hypothetical protein
MNRRHAFTCLAALVLAAAALPGMAAGPKPGGSTSRIAFTTWAPSGGNTQVFLVNPDGSGKSQLTKELWKQHRNPAWSPDGSKLAVAVDIGNIYPDTGNYLKIIDRATGTYIQFPSPQSDNVVAWSVRKDAETGAYLSWNQQMLLQGIWDSNGYFRNLFVRSPDGSGVPVQLTSCGFSDDGLQFTSAVSASWLPDAAGSTSTRISYTLNTRVSNGNGTWSLSSQEVRLMTLDASAWPAVSVISDETLPSVSDLPAGVNPPAYLVWDRQGRQVIWRQSGSPGFWLAPVLYDASGSLLGLDLANTVPLANTGTAGSPWTASFSPDGAQVAFLDNPTGGYNRSLYKVNANNTGRTLVYKGQNDITSQCWSP